MADFQTDRGVPVPDQPRIKTYEDGLREGERKGKDEGFTLGLGTGRSECIAEQRAEQQERARQEAIESRRIFWDTAYLESAKIKAEEARFDPKTEVQKVALNIGSFISDVQAMTPNELFATERELSSVILAKQEDWKKNHKWWDVLHQMPESPMKILKSDSGMVTSIEFPSQAFKIPVTYWNSQTEAAKVDALTDAVHRASNPIDRSLAERSLVEELKSLKIPQIAQLEARRSLNK